MLGRSCSKRQVWRTSVAVAAIVVVTGGASACGSKSEEPPRDSTSPNVSLNVTTPSVGGGTKLPAEFPADQVPLPKGEISRAITLESGWAFTVGGAQAFAQGVQLLESGGFSRMADAEMSRRAVFTGKGLSVVIVDSSIVPGQSGAQYTVTRVASE